MNSLFKWGVPFWCLALISLLVHCVLVSFHQKPQPSRYSTVVRKGAHGRLDPFIDEASGVCPSLSQSKQYWTHNDSLDQARLFLIKEHGQVVNEVKLPQLTNIDWEACTSTQLDHIDGENVVYVADTGNNFHWRQDLRIYALRENLMTSPVLKPVNEYLLRFPNDRQVPLNYWSKTGRCRDLESLFWRNNELFIIGKCTIGGPSTLWRLPREKRKIVAPLVLEPIQLLDIVGDHHPLSERVTGASYSAKLQLLVVLTYKSLWFFQVNGTAKSPNFTYFSRCDLNLGKRIVRQAEAVTWRDSLMHSSRMTNRSVLVLTESGDVYTYEIDIEKRSCK